MNGKFLRWQMGRLGRMALFWSSAMEFDYDNFCTLADGIGSRSWE